MTDWNSDVAGSVMATPQQDHRYLNSTVSSGGRGQLGDVYGDVHHNFRCTRTHVAGGETSEDRCRKSIFLTDPEIDRQRLIDRQGEGVARTCEWMLADTANLGCSMIRICFGHVAVQGRG